jgi:hypothetical protein
MVRLWGYNIISAFLADICTTGQAKVSTTIPKCIPNGDYLFRIEHLGLHSAGSPGGGQFYISCAQITVSGGGSTEGAPTVALPGAYKASDPGIQVGPVTSVGFVSNLADHTPRSISTTPCPGHIRTLDQRSSLVKRYICRR